jgi:hypothetical protein
MDRPEDVEVHPVTGRIYVVCTRNELRSSVSRAGHYGHRDIDLGPNAANPRGRNLWGHILELSEHAGDHRATRFRWEMLLMGGDPAAELLTGKPALTPGAPGERSSFYAGQRDARSLAAFGSPDNIGFDAAGNLWIVTDGDQPDGRNNGCFVCPTAGAGRGALRQFERTRGCRDLGCTFTPDQQTLFLSVQHPGAGGTLDGFTSHWRMAGTACPAPASSRSASAAAVSSAPTPGRAPRAWGYLPKALRRKAWRRKASLAQHLGPGRSPPVVTRSKITSSWHPADFSLASMRRDCRRARYVERWEQQHRH